MGEGVVLPGRDPPGRVEMVHESERTCACEGRISAPQVPIEPRDAERIMRELEEPYQLVVVDRLAPAITP